ncbi:hypothetical protein GCM10022221_24740 [Actinocorallia aurea]
MTAPPGETVQVAANAGDAVQTTEAAATAARPAAELLRMVFSSISRKIGWEGRGECPWWQGGMPGMMRARFAHSRRGDP